MVDRFSVCMPVHNESRCIGVALESALGQDFPGDMEVLVCANRCTDKTADIVREYERKDPRVRLIEVQEKGKPTAWNILMNEAREDFLIFGDGDVRFDRNAFKSLVNAFERTGKMSISAATVPVYNRRRDFLMKMLNYQPQSVTRTKSEEPKYFLCGRLYSVHKPRLKELMKNRGFDEIPQDVIIEDFWLDCLMGGNNQYLERNAKVYYAPCNFTDHFLISVRNMRGARQVAEQFPQFGYNPTKRVSLRTIERTIRCLTRIFQEPNIKDAIKTAMSYTIKFGFQVATEYLAKRGDIRGLDQEWKIANSSKDLTAYAK